MIDKAVLKSVTHDPGVYLFLDHADKVLYVGKAKNLRKRLASYFSESSSDDRPQIPHLMQKAVAVKTLVVSTEFEALLLENQLIKLHQPQYNVLLRSDLSHACLHLDLNNPWPILEVIRSKDAPGCKGRVFGPFLSAFIARELLELLQDLYGLRRCSLGEMQRRDRPCLWYHIKKCIAPCRLKEGAQGRKDKSVQGLSNDSTFTSFKWKQRRGGSSEEALLLRQEYMQRAHAVVKTLEGATESLEEFMHGEIEKASQRLDFERAQRLLNRKNQLKDLLQEQCIDHPKEQMDADIFSYCLENGLIVRLKVRFGRLLDRENYWIQRQYDLDTAADKKALRVEDFFNSLVQIYLAEEDYLLSQGSDRSAKNKQHKSPANSSAKKKLEVVVNLPEEKRQELALLLKDISKTGDYAVFSSVRTLRRSWHQIAEKNLKSVLYAKKAQEERECYSSDSEDAAVLNDPGVLGFTSDRVGSPSHGKEIGSLIHDAQEHVVDKGVDDVSALVPLSDTVQGNYMRSSRVEYTHSFAKRFALRSPPWHIECFDISHLGGKQTVGSCVVYKSFERDRAATRRYLLVTQGGDDLKAMEELLSRRIESLFSKKAIFADPSESSGRAECYPNLWLIDGGRAHLELAKRVVGDKWPTDRHNAPSIMSICKDSGKHTRSGTQELLFNEQGRCFTLALDDRDLLFLQRIRDETHDVAVNYQRLKRAQKVRYSSLNQVEGIGPVKKKKLLNHFGTLASLRNASVIEIAAVPGISQENAHAIVRFFQEKA